VKIATPLPNVTGGHWEYSDNFSHHYNFSEEICERTYLHEGDCKKARTCSTNLMNWQYYSSANNPYPMFDATEFRKSFANNRLIFVGSSMMRQQVLALVWTLGHDRVSWDKQHPADSFVNCTTHRSCIVDSSSNITICWQFMGSMATRVYHEGNYTLT